MTVLLRRYFKMAMMAATASFAFPLAHSQGAFEEKELYVCKTNQSRAIDLMGNRSLNWPDVPAEFSFVVVNDEKQGWITIINEYLKDETIQIFYGDGERFNAVQNGQIFLDPARPMVFWNQVWRTLDDTVVTFMLAATCEKAER